MGYDINKSFWKSKKWWMSVIAATVPVLNMLFDLDLDPTELTVIILPMIGYILGQSFVDGSHS